MVHHTYVTALLVVAALPVAIAQQSFAANGNAITHWHAIARSVNPPLGTLTVATVAAHDALNAIQRRYQPYVATLTTSSDASPEAAVATAIYRVLRTNVPSQATVLDAAYTDYMASIPNGSAKTDGIAVGEAAAAAEIKAHQERISTSSTPSLSYGESNAPGHWRPIAPNLPPGLFPFVNVQPWALENNEQFRPKAPPALTSDLYTRDFNEVRQWGAATDSRRTAEQTTIAVFWGNNNPSSSVPRAMSQVVQSRQLDLWESARLFALLQIASWDATTAAVRAQYMYYHWNPTSAIRLADIDNNPATVSDAMWTPVIDPANRPGYPSLYSSTMAAMTTVVALFFGTDDVPTAFTSTALPGVKRTFSRLTDVQREMNESRVLAGLNFRFSALAGQRLGDQVGRRVFAQVLRPSAGRVELSARP